MAALAGRAVAPRSASSGTTSEAAGCRTGTSGGSRSTTGCDDLETVVDAAGLDRFPLLGISQGGPVAIAYAVRHPERVSHLVLLGSFAQGRRKSARTPDELELADARIEMVRLGWGRPDPTYRQIFVSRFLPEATQEQWRSFDELQRRSTSPDNAWRFVDEFANIDVTDLAPKLTVPTLIMCSRREPENRLRAVTVAGRADPEQPARPARQLQPPAARARSRLAALPARDRPLPRRDAPRPRKQATAGAASARRWRRPRRPRPR